MSELINISLEGKPDITHVQENFITLNNDKLEVSNIVQGENISINVVDKIITISATGGGGSTGQDGVSLQYNWDGTSLGIKREDEINYTYVNLKGQDGIIGVDGESAYQSWLDLGNIGTEQDFINSIKGENGADGIDGRNVELRYYENYLQYRLTGDVDWINLIELTNTDSPSRDSEIPKFYSKYIKQEDDVTVVMVGDSIMTANSYASNRVDANARPPLCQEMNIFSYIEEQLRWKGQEYRRHDYPSVFTETATTKTTVDYDNAWDWQVGHGISSLVENFKPSATRVLSGTNVSVSYSFPSNMKRCNFIYRTDYLCATSTVVTISSGNGNVEVFDELTQSWVEANGYNFSTKEINTLIDYTYINYLGELKPAKLRKSIYQKRLKMRSLTVLTAKTVTITNVGEGRLNYWGIEFSPKASMIYVLNQARGAHNISRLQAFEAWDVDYFKPNLIMEQTCIINEGAMSSNNMYIGNKPSDFTERFRSYAHNLINKPYAPELLPFTLFVAVQSNIVNQATGKYNSGNIVGYGDVSVFNYIGNLATMYRENNIPHINCFNEFLDKAEKKAIREATNNIWLSAIIGSGKTGNTYTVDNTHFNDNGNIIGKDLMIPVIKLLTSEKLINTSQSTSSYSGTGNHMCRVYNSSNLSIPNGVLTALNFNSERYDTSEMHNNTTDNSRLTAPVDGIYRITGNISFATNTTGIRALYLRVNGNTNIATVGTPTVAGASTSMCITTTFNIVAGNYVELLVLHTAGVSLEILSLNAFSPEFMMEYVGDII